MFKLLIDSNRDYKIYKHTINRLFHTDDLNLYVRSNYILKSLLGIVKYFNDDIGVEFRLDKCAKAKFKAGKFVQSSNIVADTSTFIRNLQEKVYNRRLSLELQSGGNSQKRRDSIHLLAIAVVNYNVGVIKWNFKGKARIDS